LDIDKDILDSIKEIGYEEPTKIQSEAIPLIKEGYDVVGQSETGSGKTAAFGIPLVEKVTKGGGLQALILAPTRELAQQIAAEIEKFSRAKRLRIQCVYGGASIAPQIDGLRRAEIVVGTPGRVMDHLERRTMRTGKIQTFILDEADKMIDMGFIDDIRRIESEIPRERQTLMFSATMPDDLADIRDSFTRGAKKVKTETKVSEDMLKQYCCLVDRRMKFSLLVHLMRNEKPRLAIIFCNMKREVDLVAKNLKKNGINAEPLHGDMSQSRREHVMEDFHNGEIDVLVATDVAARGLDFKKVTHVFNYGIPKNCDDYVNRIGRTARAGESGKAIAMLSEEDMIPFRRIINIYNFGVEEIEYNPEEVEQLPFVRDSYSRDGGGRRGSFGRRGGYGRGGGDGGRRWGRGQDRDRGYGGDRRDDREGGRRGRYGGGGRYGGSGRRRRSDGGDGEGSHNGFYGSRSWGGGRRGSSGRGGGQSYGPHREPAN